MKYFTQGTTKQSHGRLCRILMTAMMMLIGGRAWAQTLNISTSGTYTLTSTGNGNQFSCNEFNYDYLGNVTAGAGVGITIVFDNTKTILSTGQFNVSGDGGSITLQLGSNCTACTPSKPTLKTNAARGEAWFLMANYHTNPANKSIIVLGKNPENITTDGPENFAETSSHWDGNFVLDGGAAAMEIIGDTMNRKVRLATGGIIHTFARDGGGQPFRMQQGTLTLTKVTLQNYATGGSSGNNQVSSAGIQIMTANNMDVGVKVALTQCHFTKLAASSGYCAVRMQGTKGALVTTNYVKIDHCLFDHCYCLSGDATTNDAGTAISEAGVVRTLSNFRSPVSVTNCKLENNLGPSIRHHEPYNMLIQNNIVQDNWNIGRGGGMQLRGPATLIGCKVRRNTAKGDGGGIFYGTFVDASDMNPGHSILTMDNNSVVSGNKSYGNGGGIMLCGEQIHPGSSSNNQKVAYYAYGTNGQLIEPYEPIRVEFVLNGGTISDNRSSGQGGGVCITRHKNCTFYGTNCYLKYGTITGNKTWGNNGLTGEGGGVALITSSDYDNGSISPSSTHPANTPSNYNDIKPQNINVVISEANATAQMTIQNNSGSNGGGIYVDAHPVSYHGVTSTVTTNVFDYSHIYNNKATTNGGGLYVQSGTVGILKNNDNGTHKPTISKNTATNGNGGGVYLNNGNIEMSLATIGGVDNSDPQNPVGLGNTAGTSGGGVYVNTGTVNMLSTSVLYNHAQTGSGGGIFVDNGNVNINLNEAGTSSPSNISYNIAKQHGGGIYDNIGRVLAYGSFNGDTDYPVQITYNEAETGSGGGIFCYGNGAISEYDIRLRRINVSNNKALGSAQSGSAIDLGCGGGIYLQEGKISVINGTIDRNTANVGGGGIYTHSGNIDINPTQDERNASKITNNTAELNGGGLNTHQGYIRVFGNSAANDDRIKIMGNKATTGSGGGIFCYGGDQNDEYITMRHADLVGNKALNGEGTQTVLGDEVVSGCGGGMYLQAGKIHVTDVKIQSNTAKLNGGGINNHSGNIDVDGCIIGGQGLGNSAGRSGGGIYTNQGDIDIEDYTETSGSITRIESKVTHNEAVLNGGGIDTHHGTIYINKKEEDDQIEVAFNKAQYGGGMYANAGTIVAYNALVHDNTASMNGGGINNHSGDISLYGGILSNNTAENGNGGGAYTHVGDINIKPFNPANQKNWLDLTLNDGTRIFNNIANLNGGGLNNHTGLIDLHYATLQNNTSTLGNGGGIYCEGPHAATTGFTIRLLRSMVNQNKTRGQDGTEAAPTGRGGGMYLKYGRIFAQGSNLTRNKANINGGAINNHEGNIRAYGCEISNNEATTGSGGGIYANKGLIVVGPSGKAGASVIESNIAGTNGGGINNHEGDIEINGDHIIRNVARNSGGGIYLALGNITMNGGKINENEANQKGGGVYIGGTKNGGEGFIIQERKANTPVVEIIDVEPGSTTAVVHYHIVDDGNNSSFNSSIKYGLLKQDNSAHATSVHGTDIGDVPGCRRDTITGLNAGNTYQVKVWVKNENVNPYTADTTNLVSFTTLGSTPVVHTGTASNVTATSANVNGKLVFKGNGNVLENAIGIQYSANKNMTGATNVFVSGEETVFSEGGYYTVTLGFGNPTNDYDVRKFYFRAIATNNANPAQTGYGELDSITLPKNTPSMGIHQVEYEFVTDNGVPSIRFSFEMPEKIHGNNYTNYGFVLSYDDDPELNADHTINKDNIDTIGKVFRTTVPLSLFYEGEHYPSYYYYVRAFATKASNEPNAMDITNYSITAATKFVIPDPAGKPVVRSTRITDITQHAANIHGKLENVGSSAVTAYGIVWSWTNTEPTIGGTNCVQFAGSEAITSGSGFTVHMPGYHEEIGDKDTLRPNKTYYVRTYATNSAGTAYSNNYNFTTLPVMLPNVIVKEIQYHESDHTQVTVVCEIESTGGGTISENGGYGIIYGQGTATGTTMNGSGLSNGQFSVIITGLTAHQDYWVRAFATNSAGTHTCAKVNFSTNFDKPSVTLAQIGNVSFNPTGTPRNSAEGWYSVTPHSANAGDNVKTYGVCWSTFHNPTRTNSDVANTHFADDSGVDITGSAAVTCSTNMVQRYPNTKYYVRAYASTEDPVDDPTNNTYSLANIKYSDEKSFVTLPAMQTTGVVATTHNTATLGGKIDSRDTEHHLRYYGICWGSDANPEKGTGNYVEQAITTANSSTFSYSLEATGLTVSTTYHYRAYCINENGETNYPNVVGNIAYGPDATFTTRQFSVSLSANPTEGGSVSGSYASLESNSYTASASANAGYTFTNWTENETPVSTNASYTFDVTQNRSLKANFTANQYTLTTEVNPTMGGSVTGGGEVTYNTTVTLTATPHDGYRFISWALNGEEVSTAAEYTFTYNIAGDATFVANFEPVSGRGSSQSNNRPRDIYPAPAREPWDWDDEWVETVCTPSLQTDSTVFAPADTLVPTRATAVDPVISANIPSINNNTAEYGGGVYVEHNEDYPAKIVFAGGSTTTTTGTINENTASEAGGGIYISQGASMQMKGHCQVNSNHVPAGKKGGGIYLDGTLLVGNQATDLANAHALQVNLNWIGDGAYDANTRNNVYLPTDPILTGDALHKMRVITLLSDISGVTNDGKDGETGTKIGLSVDRGFREVIYADRTTYEARDLWLSRLIPGGSLNGAIFDDANKYYALHVSQSDGMFDQDYDYLWGCWTSVVTKDPQAIDPETEEMYFPLPAGVTQHYKVEGDTWHIYTNYGLAWFSSIVNGLNKGNAAPSNTNSGPVTTLNAVIENDLDMSKYFWVPLGSVQSATSSGQTIVFDDGGEYNGTFDGQGHIIKGLICTYMTGIFKYGLFGTVGNNGVVKNTFVDDYRFTTYKQKQKISSDPDVYQDYNPTYYMGGIAAQVIGTGVIKNCEARGMMKTPMCDVENTCVGGLVGFMNSTSATGTEVHSSMAMPEIVGTTIGSTVNQFTAKNVGGLVGKISDKNILKNSFANMKLGAVDGNVKVGGLVGNNLGMVENCYARLQNTYTSQNPAPSNFYWFAGANTGSISTCYAPARTDCSFGYVPSETLGVSGHGKYGLTKMSEYGTPTDRRRKYEFDQKDQQIVLELGQTNNHVVNGIFNGLLPTLNNWVESANNPTPDPGAKEETTEPKYSTWSRTMASPLNDDYPILEFADFDCLASTDNIYLEYKADLDDMIEKYNGIENGGNIYLYSSERTNATTEGRETVTNLVNNSTDDDVRVYIDENVGILQDEHSSINARVGVTLDNSKGTTEIGGEKYDWHMFSSALKSVSMGLKYHTNETGYEGVSNYYVLNNFSSLVANGIPHSDYLQRTNMDPPKTTWFQGNVCIDSVGYFPINTPYGTWRNQPAGDNGSFDFYCYGEAYYQHWINFKREGREGLYDHWRQDPDPDNFKHYQIKYPNESTFTQAKGYMVGINEKHSDLENGGYEGNPERRNMMMADGELNNGDIEYKATYTTNPEATAYDYEVRGCNLIGNPYQSYLNFDEFIDENSGKVLGNTYFILDADAGRYVSYTSGASENPIAAPGYIHPHQGFLVKVRENQTLTFTNTMRSASGNSDSYFRSGRLNYPLVNLICTDATGKCDATTIEINRPDVGGGQKMKGIHTGNALVYVRLDGVDYQTAFAPVGITSAPVRLDVLEDGVFTMRWGTMHGDFSYLHLIDNLTGMDVDCLRQSEYHFEAKTTDYKSRFKLVFECTGVEEQEDDGSGGPSTFAFRMGDELVINGEGYLQVFDLNGRQLLAKQVYGTQNTVGLPKVAAGLYVLRLTTNNQSKTQKMVIE